MNNALQTVPRIAIQSIGLGLFLMALFTMVWTGIAQGGLQGSDHHIILVTFSLLCLVFIIYGIKVFIIAKSFPKFTTQADLIEGKAWKKRYGIIFGVEGTAIPVIAIILRFMGLPQFILPAMALIVGAHFYPMAKIFNRKIDYYIASWTCLVGTISVFMIIENQPQTLVLSFLGIGVALATSSYGLYILLTGQSFIASQQELLHNNQRT